MRKPLHSGPVTILKCQKTQEKMREAISLMTLSNQSIQSILPRKAKGRKYKD